MKDRTVDSLILDAKDAMLKAHYEKFKELANIGATAAATEQLKVTLHACGDLLKYSAQLLEEIAEEKRQMEVFNGNEKPNESV